MKPSLYRVKDAAQVLAISQWEVRRLLEAGVLERRYIGESGRFYRVTAESVDRYVESLPSERGESA